MNVTTIGIDLAKNSFSVHGVDARGKGVLRQNVSRTKLLALLANQPPSLIGMEACSGAHHWARQLVGLGHRVGIMAPRFVAPYRKGAKNEGNDAEAVCEAVARPGMRFVPVKSAEQQAVLCLHRIRAGLIKERTATINQLRGLLAEFGLVMPKGRYADQHQVPAIF
jgi:transposase